MERLPSWTPADEVKLQKLTLMIGWPTRMTNNFHLPSSPHSRFDVASWCLRRARKGSTEAKCLRYTNKGRTWSQRAHRQERQCDPSLIEDSRKVHLRPTTKRIRNLRRKKNNRSARADIYAIEILRKVDRRGSRKVLRMKFVIVKIQSKEQRQPSYE